MNRLTRFATATAVALTAAAVITPAANAVDTPLTRPASAPVAAAPGPVMAGNVSVASFTSINTTVQVVVTGLKSDAAASWAARTIGETLLPFHLEDATVTYAGGTLKFNAYLLTSPRSPKLSSALAHLKKTHRWYTITTGPAAGTRFTMTAPNRAAATPKSLDALSARLSLVVDGHRVAVRTAPHGQVEVRYNSVKMSQAQLTALRAEVVRTLNVDAAQVKFTR